MANVSVGTAVHATANMLTAAIAEVIFIALAPSAMNEWSNIFLICTAQEGFSPELENFPANKPDTTG